MRLQTRKLLRWLLVLVLLWLVGVTISIWSFAGKSHSEPADSIIVLGAAVYGAKPSPVFEERIKHGIHLYQKGLAPKLIFTGGFGSGASQSESQVAQAYAIAQGVPALDILIETQSQTTSQNLREAQKLIHAHGLHSALIVSDPLHMRRAVMMAEDLGINAFSSPTPTSRYQTLKTQWKFLIREVYFLHHYLVTGN